MKKKILFIIPYPPGKAASQRFRFEQYLTLLDQNNYDYELNSFLSDRSWNILYKRGFFLKKFTAMILGCLNRFLLLFRINKYDYIFIHREDVPLGPSFFSFIASKWLKKKIIYDFDDAIWIPNSSESNRFFSFLKNHSNTKNISKRAYKVSCGNEYLCNYAKSFNDNVIYNPTTIDTVNYHNRVKNHDISKKINIGWSGTHSTIGYLNKLVPILKKLETTFDFDFIVISDLAPEFELDSLKFVKWNKSSEINDLLRFNIGVMPLENDRWAQGKCGFKALQYMALGIPAIVSPVGVNAKIVTNGKDGFVCDSDEEWYNTLKNLMQDQQQIKQLGTAAREKIIKDYSVESNSSNFLHLLD